MLTTNRTKRVLAAGLVAAVLLVAPAGLSFTTTGTAYAARAATNGGGATGPATTTYPGGSNVQLVKGNSTGEPGGLDADGCAWMADRINEHLQAAHDARDQKTSDAETDFAVGLIMEGAEMGCRFT